MGRVLAVCPAVVVGSAVSVPLVDRRSTPGNPEGSPAPSSGPLRGLGENLPELLRGLRRSGRSKATTDRAREDLRGASCHSGRKPQ